MSRYIAGIDIGGTSIKFGVLEEDGTLLYSTDFDALETAIRPPGEKLERHGVSSVRQRVANLSECLDRSVVGSVEALEEFLIKHFTDGEIRLDTQQAAEIEEMSKKYIKYTR